MVVTSVGAVRLQHDAPGQGRAARLMAAGLVAVHHGKGAYVADPRTGPVAALLTSGLTDE